MLYDKKEYVKKECYLRPRNFYVRNIIRKQARAIAEYIKEPVKSRQRIFGIDACSMEIGCRPETYATEYRYIRQTVKNRRTFSWYKNLNDNFKSWGMTYHVGEDFLDIIDGLRAVDEAVKFLELEKGGRLGHALVLGIAPQEYYELKRFSVCLRKQDCLDNVIWLMFRALELNVSISTNYRAEMENFALDIYVYMGRIRSKREKIIFC
ncbi:MAG: hypothetical protein J6J79_00060 [Lachnospiraceae bacterium]|nr:hypothetical protein [Lachnospiraceae bacterium]